MNSKDFYILIVIIVMLIAALFGGSVHAQKVQVTKKVEVDSDTHNPDSAVVIVKTIKTNKNGLNEEKEDIDSILELIHSGSDTIMGQTVKIISIINGDTIINESNSNAFDPDLFKNFNSKELEESMFLLRDQLNNGNDSLWRGLTWFDSIADPLNFEFFNHDWTDDFSDMDSIMRHHFILNTDDDGNPMIVFNDNGDELRIERNGKHMFINKSTPNDSVLDDNKVTKKYEIEKVFAHANNIQMEELNDSEKSQLKSKGVKFSSKEPDFDYLKLDPKPMDGSINIEFKNAKPINLEITVSNMDGKTFYEEKLNRFSGTFNKEINIGENGPGKYLLQIVQGKKAIIRKIIVD